MKQPHPAEEQQSGTSSPPPQQTPSALSSVPQTPPSTTLSCVKHSTLQPPNYLNSATNTTSSPGESTRTPVRQYLSPQDVLIRYSPLPPSAEGWGLMVGV